MRIDDQVANHTLSLNRFLTDDVIKIISAIFGPIRLQLRRLHTVPSGIKSCLKSCTARAKLLTTFCQAFGRQPNRLTSFDIRPAGVKL